MTARDDRPIGGDRAAPIILAAQGPASGRECEISVVVPAYNEEGNIARLYSGVRQALDPLGATWEIVFADDGSSDGTWAEITRLHAQDARVRGIRLSRNFGHQHALYAGMVAAGGRAVVSMDADLQHPPEVVPRLIHEWRRGSKIVHTVRIDSPETTFFKRTSSRVFYRVYSALSGVPIDPGMADFRLLDRQVVDGLLQFREGGLFLRGLVQWVGYPSSKVVFQCAERASGVSKYSFRKMLKFAWSGVKSFSILPLRIATLAGLVTSGVAFLSILYAVGAKLLGLYTLPGWASVLAIVSFQFGVLFVLLGVIGEYIGEILKEVRCRPRFLLQEQLGIDHGARAQPFAAVLALPPGPAEVPRDAAEPQRRTAIALDPRDSG